MAKYVSLVNWTEKGIAGFKETVNRSEVAAQIALQTRAPPVPRGVARPVLGMRPDQCRERAEVLFQQL